MGTFEDARHFLTQGDIVRESKQQTLHLEISLTSPSSTRALVAIVSISPYLLPKHIANSQSST